MTSYNENELISLLSLLDDADEEVHISVTNRLITLGEPITARLEEYLSVCTIEAVQYRIEHVLYKIQFNKQAEKLLNWASQPNPLLEKALNIIASIYIPDIDEKWIESQLQSIATTIDLNLNFADSLLDKILCISNYIYEVYGFEVSVQTRPQHFYLNHVLAFRQGHPILLAALYHIIARRLQFSICGLYITEEFMLGCVGTAGLVPINFQQSEVVKVHFFIDPANKGAILTKTRSGRSAQKKSPFREGAQVYQPLRTTVFVAYLLKHLAVVFEQDSEHVKSKDLAFLCAKLLVY